MALGAVAWKASLPDKMDRTIVNIVEESFMVWCLNFFAVTEDSASEDDWLKWKWQLETEELDT